MRLLLAAIFFAFFLSPAHAAREDGMPAWSGGPSAKQQQHRSDRRAVRRAYAKRPQARTHRGKRVAAHTRGKRIARAARRAPAVRAAPVAVESVEIQTPFGVSTRTFASRSGVPAAIGGFLAAVQAQCGAVNVVSTFRPGSRVGGRLSCHALGQAVDYRVSNPSCALRLANSAYRYLGHSIDYFTAPGGTHYHVSNCRQEAGVRFVHHGGGARYARRGTRVRIAAHSRPRVHRGVRYASVRRR